jgi:hypothetical protein
MGLRLELQAGVLLSRTAMRHAGDLVQPEGGEQYACPEAIVAASSGEAIAAVAAHDMFSLGALAYEVIAQQPPCASAEAAMECAAGRTAYPWYACQILSQTRDV